MASSFSKKKAFVFTLCMMLLTTTVVGKVLNQNTLRYDFPQVQIGMAENSEGPTGITLFYFPEGAQAAIDVRGGSVGTFFTQEKMFQGEAYIDGIAFTGGGILGMEAMTGAISSLFAKENKTTFSKMPLITGAVIFDFTPRNNAIYPDKVLGQKAFASLKTGEFLQGKHGAGISATIGKLLGDSYKSAGQGGAFAQVGQTKIAVFTVVNAMGVILDEHGKIVYGSQMTKEGLLNHTQALLQQEKKPFNPGAKNTTLTVVIINEKLSPRHLQQLGRQVHHALSEVIYPYATILDGDVLYTVSTRTIESSLYAPGADISTDLDTRLIYLGMVAGELAKQAVWSAVGYTPH